MERKGSCCPFFHEKHHCLHNLSVCKLRPYTGHFLHFFVYVGFISLNKFLSAESFQRALALHQFKKLAVKITHQCCLFKTITSDHCTRRKYSHLLSCNHASLQCYFQFCQQEGCSFLIFYKYFS